MARITIGVDVGGSGVKGALVNLDTGVATGRVRIETPQPATPKAIAQTVRDVVAQLDAPPGAFGCTMPGVGLNGTVRSAAHIDESWIGTKVSKVMEDATGRACVALNDADAAGLAEARFGAARDEHGVVVLVTIGTGVGTALLHKGQLVPNAELGHILVGTHVADTWVSDATRQAKQISWKQWSARFNAYLEHLHELIWPELIVVGGGIVKHSDRFLDRVDPGCEVRIAELGNLAGIVGAALAAEEAG